MPGLGLARLATAQALVLGLARGRRGVRVLAETAEECALLADALARSGELPLREALFPVTGEALRVPRELDPLEAESLRRDFEAAALADQRVRAPGRFPRSDSSFAFMRPVSGSPPEGEHRG